MRCLEWRLCAPARGIKLSAPPSSPSPPPSPPSATPPLSLENVVLKRTLPPDASTPHTIVRTLFRLRDPELTVVQGKLGAARSELLAAWNSLKALRASTSVKVRGPPQTTDAHVAQRISEGIAAAESEANSRLKGERTIRHAAEKSCATAEAQLDKLRASTAAAARAALQLQVVAMRRQVLTASLSRDAAIARVEAARETVRELGARHQETCGHLAGVRAANKAGEARESSLEGKLTAAEQEIARLKQELSDAQRKASRAGSLARTCAVWENDCAELQAELVDREADVEVAQQQLAAMDERLQERQASEVHAGGRPRGHDGRDKLEARWASMSKSAHKLALWRHTNDIVYGLAQAGAIDWLPACHALALKSTGYLEELLRTRVFMEHKFEFAQELANVAASRPASPSALVHFSLWCAQT